MGKKKKSTQQQGTSQQTSQGSQPPAPQGAQQAQQPAPQRAQQQPKPPTQESQSPQQGFQQPHQGQQRPPAQQESQGHPSQQQWRQPGGQGQQQQPRQGQQQAWQGQQQGQHSQQPRQGQQQQQPRQGQQQQQQPRQGQQQQQQPRQGQQQQQQPWQGQQQQQPRQGQQQQQQPWQGQQQQQPRQGQQQQQPWQGQQQQQPWQGQQQPRQGQQQQQQPWHGQQQAMQGQHGPPQQSRQGQQQGQPQPWQGQRAAQQSQYGPSSQQQIPAQQVPVQQQQAPVQQQQVPVQQQQQVPVQQQQTPVQQPPTPKKQGWKQLPSQPSSRDVSHSPSPVHEFKQIQISDVPKTPTKAGGDSVRPTEMPSKMQEDIKSPPQKEQSESKGKELAIPQRSKLNKTGTRGRPIAIETNHLLLQIQDFLQPIIHYDVAIEPDKPKKLLRVVMEECRKKNYAKRFPAYDGSKSLYSSSYLPFGKHISDEIKIMENEREKLFNVTIKYAANIDLNSLKKYFTSSGTGRGIEIPQDAIQCLDVVLRSAPSLRCIPVGRSFFTRPDRFLDLGEGMEMYHGFFQSAILGWKPFLNVDVAHKAFPKSLGIVDLITELCENQPLAGENFTKVDKFLRNLKVRYEIPSHPASKRISRVNQLDKPASTARFKDENGREMTVAEYYTRIKNYKLKYPELPCLWIGSRDRKILYPPELCTLLEGQVTNRAMTPNQTSRMIRHAATPCDERKRKIMASVTAASFNTDACVREFGISVSNQFTKIDARVLSSPKLLYSQKTIQPTKGVWRADRFQVGKPLTKWAILAVDGRTREQALQMFAEKMITQGKVVGMTIEKPSNLYSRRLSYRGAKEELKTEFMKFKGYELVVVVIPDDKDTYGYVKQVAELNMGTLTQCVRGKNVFNPKDATVANILLKVNAKLNGVNHSLYATPACLRRPCMIMGADVTHPSPESRGTTPSVAAVTASHDPKAFQYNISWRLQPPTQEIISDLANIVREHLLFFFRKNKAKPERIIFFRDGVSEGQFKQVLQNEVTAIRNACLMLQKDGTYQPKVTFLVVQKRHHTRFFPQNARDSEDRNCNVPAGTIVDTEITHPTDVDFYLVSHASIQGTARPTRYRKLWDDCDMDEDELEELTYHLCHMFTRCTRSVSYPAPTYYAHLAAARAKVYCENISIDVNNLGRTQAQLVIKPEIITDMPMFFV